MAVPTFIAFSKDTTSLVVTRPTGTQDGDLLVTHCYANCTNDTLQPPGGSGWAKIKAITNPAIGGYDDMWFYKFVQAGDPSTWTFTQSGGSVVGFHCICYRNVRALGSGAAAADIITYTSGLTTSYPIPNLTTPESDCVVLACASTFAATLTPPSGFTERMDVDSVGYSDKYYASASSMGSLVYDPNSAAVGNVASIVLLPTLDATTIGWLPTFVDFIRNKVSVIRSGMSRSIPQWPRWQFS